MSFSLAVVQPVTAHGAGARQANLALARAAVDDAAQRGAAIVCFPETFPGAWRAPVTWTPEHDLAQLAREAGVYLVGSFAEPVDAAGERCYITAALFDPDGREVGRYRRISPALTPWVYGGGPLWDFDYTQGGDLPVFDTKLGRIGLLVCSEVYIPELARALAVQGAELIVVPSGLIGPNRALYQTWRTLVWARAIENLVCLATSANLIGPDDCGLAMICSPEGVLIEANGEGVFLAEIDLDRVRWLRDQEDRRIGGATPWRTKPGLLRDWLPPARAAADRATIAPSGAR